MTGECREDIYCRVSTSGKGPLSVGSNGFTLLDLITALALFSILSTIALGSWSRLLPKFALNSASRQVQSDLNRIRMQAASENISFQLIYSGGAPEFRVRRKDSASWITKALPEGIIIKEAGSITFSGRGTARGNSVKLCNTNEEGKNIVVMNTGRVRICKPNSCNEKC